MATSKIMRKKVTVSDFKAHCTQYLKEVESGEQEIEITRHGKTIAVTKAPQPEESNQPLLGAAIETAVLTASYDPHASVWEESDWEMNQE